MINSMNSDEQEDKRLFHKITEGRFEQLKDLGYTWDAIQKQYKKPDWCAYPDALAGIFGCWSLTSLRIRCKEDCGDCECIIR